MIATYIQGGLGNQLFQYATAKRLSVRYKCELVIDHSWYQSPRIDCTPRSFELNKYPIAARLATPKEISCWRPMRSRWATYLKPLLPLNFIHEVGYHANRNVLSAPSNTYLSGFWQSEVYFKDIRSELLHEFTPLTPPSYEDQNFIDRIQETESISIHVRRGDYVSLASANSYHGLCSLEYYQKAISYIADRVNSPNLFVFSDDPDWTKENLRSPFSTYYIDHNPSQLAFQDLRLMSLCRHHILANSSFSWWGAWLSRSNDGLVVAPERWFEVNRPTDDLIPSNWKRISG